MTTSSNHELALQCWPWYGRRVQNSALSVGTRGNQRQKKKTLYSKRLKLNVWSAFKRKGGSGTLCQWGGRLTQSRFSLLHVVRIYPSRFRSYYAELLQKTRNQLSEKTYKLNVKLQESFIPLSTILAYNMCLQHVQMQHLLAPMITTSTMYKKDKNFCKNFWIPPSFTCHVQPPIKLIKSNVWSSVRPLETECELRPCSGKNCRVLKSMKM